MKKIILLLSFLFVFSCGTKSINRLYEHFLCDYRITIPAGYSEIILDNGEEHVLLYKYPDSSVFYMAYNTTLNIENLHKEEKYLIWLDDFYKGDTNTYEGKNLANKYWKDHILERMTSIGYLNVPKERKKEFDEAIISARKLRGIRKWWRKIYRRCQ